MKAFDLILSTALLIVPNLLGAQQADNSPATGNSAEVSGLLQDYQVSNNHFNGLLNIKLPIYQYTTSELTIPINIFYNGGGNQIDGYPGIAGLGWNLDVGGMITRGAKGQPDEYWPMITQTQSISGTSITTVMPYGTDKSYLSNATTLNRTDWASSTFVNTLNTNSLYYTFQPGLTTYNANPLADLQPDKFFFSVNGMHGEFAMDHTGAWVVKSDQPGMSFQVQHSVLMDVKVPNLKIIKRAFVEFILTGTDGTKYYFGENNVDNPKNIEYTHSGRYEPSQTFTGQYSALIPSSWKLAKIVTPLGKQILFQNKTMGYQSQKVRNYYGISQLFPMLYEHSVNKAVTESWYLEKIIGPDGVMIEFNLVPSVQLGTNEGLASDQIIFVDLNGSMPTSAGNALNTYPKLEDIKVSYNGVVANKTTFSYIENINERLKLEFVKQSDLGTMNIVQYKFGYNSTKLPVYGSGKADRWGYFNNVNYFENPASTYTYNQWAIDLPASKAPNFTYGKAEILESMQLPTGGIMEFSYQPHQYSKLAQLFPFTISDEGINKEAGGARIWKVVQKDNSSVIKQTEYIYEREGSTLTSGILTSPFEVYVYGTPADYLLRTSGFNKFNRSGAHVVYSRVTEKINSNNGYTVYEYESYDNGMNDAIPLLELPSVHDPYNNGYYSSLSSFRGKLKKQKVYSNSGLLKETEYLYNHNFGNTRKLRAINFMPSVRFPASSPAFRATAYEMEFGNDLRVSTKTTEYTSAGSIQIVTENTYDELNNNIESRVYSSNNEVTITTRKFSNHPSYASTGTDNVSLGIQFLKTAKIYNALIESINVKATNTQPLTNQRVISGSVNTYYADKPLLKEVYSLELADALVLGSYTTSAISASSFVMDNRYRKKLVIYDYDDFGNMVTSSSEGDIKHINLWGYNKRYSVAKITNAEYATVAPYIDQNILDNPSSDQQLRDHLAGLRNIAGASVTISTYKPLIGITSETDINGKTTFYEYDGFGRLCLVRDNNYDILKRICYNYSGQPIACLLAPGTVYKNPGMGQVFYYSGTCGRPQLGGPVYYYVPANKYSSTISQEDANVQAQNEINANGQTYADAHFNCINTNIACGQGNCGSMQVPEKKCVNNQCQVGFKWIFFSKLTNGIYTCRYRFVWSDGTVSQDFETTSTSPCQ
jgi:YD repeat-containing protein